MRVLRLFSPAASRGAICGRFGPPMETNITEAFAIAPVIASISSALANSEISNRNILLGCAHDMHGISATLAQCIDESGIFFDKGYLISGDGE